MQALFKNAAKYFDTYDIYGHSPLQNTFNMDRVGDRLVCVVTHCAADCAELLLSRKASLRVPPLGNTLLQDCIINNAPACAKLLVNAGHCLHPTHLGNQILAFSAIIPLCRVPVEPWKWLAEASAHVPKVERCDLCGFDVAEAKERGDEHSRLAASIFGKQFGRPKCSNPGKPVLCCCSAQVHVQAVKGEPAG